MATEEQPVKTIRNVVTCSGCKLQWWFWAEMNDSYMTDEMNFSLEYREGLNSKNRNSTTRILMTVGICQRCYDARKTNP